MRTKGNYLSVKVGGTLDIGQPRVAALVAKALRGAGLTVLALDSEGRLLDEKAALKGPLDQRAPALVSVRGDVMTLHRWKLKGSRPRRGPRAASEGAEGGGHGQG